jgi:hypothetical protein
MYATLSLSRLLLVLVWPFALILIGLLAFAGFPHDPRAWLRTIGTAVSVWGILLVLLAGWTSRYAPWRVLWSAIPGLNRWLFPDLNGEWRGTTSSNWPMVKAMLDAATAKGGLDPDGLATIPLQDDEIVITIRASLFYFRLNAKLSSTGGTSHSLTALVSKDARRDIFELQYLFSQDTPEAGILDDATHLGAVTADIDIDQWAIKGYYWTRRTWRSGLSTAGRIEVRRVSR